MESILIGKSSPDHIDTEDNNSKRSAVALEDTAKDNNKDTNNKNKPPVVSGSTHQLHQN